MLRYSVNQLTRLTHITTDTMDEPKILLAELADLEELVNPSTADDSDDGGLDSYAGIGFVDELYASVDDEEVRSSNIGRDDFKIRHSSGNFKMKR